MLNYKRVGVFHFAVGCIDWIWYILKCPLLISLQMLIFSPTKWIVIYPGWVFLLELNCNIICFLISCFFNRYWWWRRCRISSFQAAFLNRSYADLPSGPPHTWNGSSWRRECICIWYRWWLIARVWITTVMFKYFLSLTTILMWALSMNHPHWSSLHDYCSNSRIDRPMKQPAPKKYHLWSL